MTVGEESLRRRDRGLGWPLACLVMVSTFATRSALAAPLFGMPSTYQIDSSPLRVVAGDIDAKNGTDLVTGNDTGENGPSLSILLNRGTGTFQAEVRKNLNADRDLLQAVTVGDFNGDGAADVAVATDDLSVFPTQTVVQVFHNNGSGLLSGPDQYPQNGFFPECLETADVNNDGIPDLVVCHSTSDSGDGLISVLTGRASSGKPNGTFDGGIDFTVGTTPASIAVGDIDGDGRNDVVVADTDSRRVFLLYGTGNTALLGSPLTLGDVDAPSAVRLRQAPGAALPEILVASLSSSQILVFQQTAPRTFAPPVPLAVGQTSADVGVADFDGDGITDLALLNPVGGKLNIWYGTANGSFTFGEAVSVDDAANSLAVADLDGDGRPDVATTSLVTNKVTVALNGGVRPSPTATAHGTATPSPTRSVATPTPTRTLSLPGTATPTRTATPTPTPRDTPTPTFTPIGPGDANCDGRIDADDIDAVIARLFGPGCGGADVDGDGVVTASDLLLLIQMLSESVR